MAARETRFLGRLAELLFPAACPVCFAEKDDQPIAAARSRATAICAACAELLAPPIENSCDRCAAPVGPFVDASDGCVHCQRQSFRFDRVFRLGVYASALQACVLRAKQPGEEVLMAELVRLLFDRYRDDICAAPPQFVLPIPTHWRQRLNRRHDPPMTMANAMSRLVGAKCDPLLLSRNRVTATQKSLVVTRRRANQRGTMTVRGRRELNGARVMVVDDVLTTGSTLNEAARMLKQAGAAAVDVAVIGRVLLPR